MTRFVVPPIGCRNDPKVVVLMGYNDLTVIEGNSVRPARWDDFVSVPTPATGLLDSDGLQLLDSDGVVLIER